MFDEMGKSIDAVTVSTPDHCHASAALMAMRMGKHCFCQKPLTHIDLRGPADGQGGPREEGRHADGQPGHGQRRAAQGGGDDQVGGAGHGEGSPRLDRTGRSGRKAARGPTPSECPPNVHWDLWLGPAPDRPYARRLPSVSPGAAGGISAPAPWATWPATRSTCRSWR